MMMQILVLFTPQDAQPTAACVLVVCFAWKNEFAIYAEINVICSAAGMGFGWLCGVIVGAEV
jgi:hypothetical protein